MEWNFVTGCMTGFLAGLVFSMIVMQIVTKMLIKIATTAAKSTRVVVEEENDPADWWKKGKEE